MTNSSTLIRSYKYRIYPNATQTAQLERILSVACRVYNDIAHTARLEYDAGEKWNWQRASKFWYSEECPKYPFIGEVLHNDTINDLVRRYDFNLKSFWGLRKNGHTDAMPPGEINWRKFRSVGFRYRGRGCKLFADYEDVARLQLYAVTGFIRVHYHWPIPDNFDVKHCVVTQRGDKWWAVFQSEDKTFEPVLSDKPAVGIDLGLYSLLALSDGTIFENPRLYRRELDKRRVLKRREDRQRRASNPDNYNENGTVKENAVIWRKSPRLRETERRGREMEARIVRRREQYYHEITDQLTQTYGLIAIEAVSPQFMIHNPKQAISAHDAAWKKIVQMLDYKCAARGVQLVKVNPAYTSQMCSGSDCGEIVQKDLSVRIHRCVSCGLEIDRDVNAARNILNLALERPVQGPSGVTQADRSNVP